MVPSKKEVQVVKLAKKAEINAYFREQIGDPFPFGKQGPSSSLDVD